jgi:PilZ domain-containing protein
MRAQFCVWMQCTRLHLLHLHCEFCISHLIYTDQSVSTVLIAPPEHLQTLTEREDFSGARTFSDHEALRALEVITRKRPDVVALERTFAATTRGAALINRIKADPKLATCEIRIVAHDSGYARVPASAAPAPATDGAAVAVVAPAPPAVPLDQRGTRRAPRVRIVEGVEVLIDGNTATLVDLSIIGAQVVSPTILKPNQRVRMSMGEGHKSLRFSAGIAWASFELAKTGPRYRAGVEFFDAEPEAVQQFCDAKKQ